MAAEQGVAALDQQLQQKNSMSIRAAASASGSGSESDLKRKLDSAFGPVAQEVATAKRIRLSGRLDTAQLYKDYLGQVSSQTCGYCYVMKAVSDVAHCPKTCPRMGASRQREFKRFLASVEFEGSGRPCFLCYIPGLGGNALHAKYQRGLETCTHPHLLPALLFAVYCDPSMRQSTLKPSGELLDSLGIGLEGEQKNSSGHVWRFGDCTWRSLLSKINIYKLEVLFSSHAVLAQRIILAGTASAESNLLKMTLKMRHSKSVLPSERVL